MYTKGGGKILYRIIYSVWFLKSLFCCILLYYLGTHLKQKVIGVILVLILSQFIYWFKINDMFPCFLAGCVLRHKINFVENHRFYIFGFSFLIFSLLIVWWNREFLERNFNNIGPFIILNSENISNYILTQCYVLLVGLSASIALFCGFMSLAKKIKNNSIGSYLGMMGSSTLGIYVLQYILLETIFKDSFTLERYNYVLADYFIAPVCAIILAILFGETYQLFRRAKFSIVLFGKSGS